MDSENVVHDDMHARAILLRFMREARESYMEKYRKMEESKSGGRYTFKRYLEACKHQGDLYGDALVFKDVYKNPRRRREQTYFVAFGGLQFYEEAFKHVKEGKLYPVTLDILDSKISSAMYGTRIVFYLSEHALIKMIRRSQCASIGSLVHLIRLYIEPFVRCLLVENMTEDFVAVCAESYMPCTLDEEGKIIVKTWISRSSWTPQTEAKLWQACEILSSGNNVALIPTEVFESSKFMSEESIRKYLIC